MAGLAVVILLVSGMMSSRKRVRLRLCRPPSWRAADQEWGRPARFLSPGDVVSVPAGAKHWHGAARRSWSQHVAQSVPGKGAHVEWLEPVPDEEYDALVER